jgi:hypothetical protein
MSWSVLEAEDEDFVGIVEWRDRLNKLGVKIILIYWEKLIPAPQTCDPGPLQAMAST